MASRTAYRRIAAGVTSLVVLPALAFGGEDTASAVSPFSMIPFILLLALIALMPFINKHWWESHYPHVTVALALPVIAYYLFVVQHTDRLLTTGHEYLSFIIFIGSLFVVAGGVHIRIRGKATPLSNVLFLAAGAVIANIMGTTGASMIMIRPFLRVNKYRLRAFHVVFFIFIISNVGGALTPIGDPPLFLGYLKGVPFFWVLVYVWHMWAIALGALLLIFFVIDYTSMQSHKKRHPQAVAEAEEEVEVSGLPNFLFLAVIVCAAFVQRPAGVREAIMFLAAAGSYFFTKKEIHAKNDFNFIPLKEVAVLFFGIFATMLPALEWLEYNAGLVGISTPGQFYWSAGILSSVLDNAPTYLSFLSASIGLFVDADIVNQVQHLVSTNGADIAAIAGRHGEEIRNTFATLLKYHGDLVAAKSVPVDDINISYLIGNHNIYLKSISIASVFFGACTYIGNGPNFMVRSIAEQAKAHVPTFAGYVGRYTLPILVPVLAGIWFLFFR